MGETRLLTVHLDGANIVTVDCQEKVCSVAFHPDGRHIVGGGWEGKLRRWDVEDGHEVGEAMEAGYPVFAVGVSRDGRWIVTGGRAGKVNVWDARTHQKVIEAEGHRDTVVAIDISPDSATFVTGSGDRTAIVWDIRTGQKRVGALEHDYRVHVVKFSPGVFVAGDRLATVQAHSAPVHIFDSRSGKLLVKTQVETGSRLNANLVWSQDGQKIFVAPCHANKILCLNGVTGSLLAEWATHDTPAQFPSLASSGLSNLLALQYGDHISFWDTASANKRVGSVVEHARPQSGVSLALSPDDNHLVTTGEDKKITIRRLRPILSQSYVINAFSSENPQRTVIRSPGMPVVEAEPHSPQPPQGIVSCPRAQRELCVHLMVSFSAMGRSSVTTHACQQCSFQSVDTR